MEFKVGDRVEAPGIITGTIVCINREQKVNVLIKTDDITIGNSLEFVQSHYPYLINMEIARMDNPKVDKYWVNYESALKLLPIAKPLYSQNHIINIRRNKKILSYRIVCFYKRVGSEDFYLTECLQGYNGNPIGYFSQSVQILYNESGYNTIRKNPIFRVLSDVELGASIKLEKSTDRECYKAVSQTEEEFTLKTKSKKSHINFETL